MSDYFVYILLCADGSYYTGHTDDIDRRVAQHRSGTVDGYTATRLPVDLVWSQRCDSRDQAFANERQIKNWSRAKKAALIAGDWGALKRAAQPPRERASRAGTPPAPPIFGKAQDRSGPTTA